MSKEQNKTSLGPLVLYLSDYHRRSSKALVQVPVYLASRKVALSLGTCRD